MDDVEKFVNKKRLFFYNKKPKSKFSKFIYLVLLILLIISFDFNLFTLNDYELNIEFQNILPRINLKDKGYVPTKNEIYKSRTLYISDNNLTNEYIHYLRPINYNEEKKFSKELYDGIRPDTSFLLKRKNQIDSNKFFNICNQEKLINNAKIKYSGNPLISIIIIIFNKENEIIKSLRSIQNQSFKNIEIIIVDDCSTDNTSHILESLLTTDPRIRIFTHLKNMGAWRSRLDGFLYSNAPYVIHFDCGDLYADNLVLEDAYYFVTKYNLDSLRFSFILTRSKDILYYKNRIVDFKKRDLKIVYGRRHYNIYGYRFGTIWNRLVRANIFIKGLDYLDEYILNAYKNLFEDRWWNTLANNASYSYLMINRIGYIYLKIPGGEGHLRIGDYIRNVKTLKELIYFWLFDYLLSYEKDDKKKIINEIYPYINHSVLNFSLVKNKFPPFNRLLDLLINDIYVNKSDRIYLKELKNNI